MSNELKFFFLFRKDGQSEDCQKNFKVSVSTISRTITNFNIRKHFSHFANNGRPSKCSDAVLGSILKFNKENSKLSLRKIAASVQKDTKTKISYVSIKNYLNKKNIFAFSPIKKPLLTPIHIKNRYELSKKFLLISKSESKKIVFSDESKFNLRSSDGKCSVRREPKTWLLSKNLEHTVEFNVEFVMV